MKNAINKTTMSGNNHINILNITTATKIAIIMNAKSLSSIWNHIFSILYKVLIQNIINEKNQK